MCELKLIGDLSRWKASTIAHILGITPAQAKSLRSGSVVAVDGGSAPIKMHAMCYEIEFNLIPDTEESEA